MLIGIGIAVEEFLNHTKYYMQLFTFRKVFNSCIVHRLTESIMISIGKISCVQHKFINTTYNCYHSIRDVNAIYKCIAITPRMNHNSIQSRKITVVRSIDEFKAVKRLSRDGSLSFIPTMGALHYGHKQLIRRGRDHSMDILVSVFVNPLQFDKKEDLDKYPLTPDNDIQMAEEAGATMIYFPTVDEIYPKDECNKVLSAGNLGSIYEGASRPGHFDGVVTVVDRLFTLLKPTRALFGEKDFQQLCIVKAMKYPKVEIKGFQTIREDNGLAYSSRNVRLSDDGKIAAGIIYHSLKWASVQRKLPDMIYILHELLSSEKAFTLDYAEIIDEEDMSLATDSTKKKRAIVAGWVEGVRLIDNMKMNQPK